MKPSHRAWCERGVQNGLSHVARVTGRQPLAVLAVLKHLQCGGLEVAVETEKEKQGVGDKAATGQWW